MRKALMLVLGLFMLCTQLLAQNRTITGRVRDDKGTPLSNVSVQVKGTSTGTVTGSDGTYSISVPPNAKALIFSSVDMSAQTISINNENRMDVNLQARETQLDEVVVTGITRTKRSQYAGAASKIDQASIANRPVGSFDQLIQGRAPGVLALTGSGAPGSSTTLRIRGTGSIAGTSTPLYVVDGIPVEAGVFQSLNPNDFESLDILRDAAATALYGSRGSSGVVVVTTKRGTGGKMKLSYSGQMGKKQRPEFTIDMMTTPELLKAQEEYGLIIGASANTTTLPGYFYSKRNPGYASLTSAQQAEYNRIYDSIAGINTNWRDEFLRDANFSNHQLALSGGTGKTRIYSSLGIYNEEGITYRTDMNRITWRNNIDYADDKLTFAVSSNLGYTKRNFQQTTANFNTGNPFLATSIGTPYARLYNTDGSIATGVGVKYAGANTFELTMLDQNYSDQLKATLGLTTAYKITDNISAAITTGIDFRETQSSNYGNKTAFSRRTSTTVTTNAGFQTEGLTRFFQADVRPSVSYRNIFNDRHDVDVSVYGEYLKQIEKTMSETGYGIDPRTPNTLNAVTQGDAVNKLFANVSGTKGRGALLSGLATARYTFDGKYTLTGSYRKDGSSKLAEGNKWVGFYAIGGIWEATKEDFLTGNRILNLLRLKLSYGGSGNADNFPRGYYPYQATYASGTYSGLTTQYSNYPGNPDMTWETTWVTNLGIDYGFAKNKVWGDINVYNKTTKDLFIRRTLSATSGFSSINVNAGELQNKGIEFSTNVSVIRKKDFEWSLNGNFGYNKNEVTDLGGEPSYTVGTSFISLGLPLGSHYEVKYGGIDAATGAELYYDANGKLTTNYTNGVPVQEFGTWESPWKGGFGTDINFKGFRLSTIFSWQAGGTKYDNLQYFTENPNGFLAFGYNQANTLKFWQKPGDIVSTPSPLYNTNFTSKLIHSTDFLRWRDLTISYALPKRVLSSIKFISNARFYVQGTNLKMWTNWKGMDPEAGDTNLSVNEFPNPRAFTTGLDISF